MKLSNAKKTSIIMGGFVLAIGFLLLISGLQSLNTDGGAVGLLFIIGGVMSLIGVTVILVSVLTSEPRKGLKKTGQKFSGVITEIVPDYTQSVGKYHKHPQIAVCNVVDEYSGETFIARSASYYTDLSKLVEREVDVYVDKSNREKYYVDLKGAVDEYNLSVANSNVHDLRR